VAVTTLTGDDVLLCQITSKAITDTYAISVGVHYMMPSIRIFHSQRSAHNPYLHQRRYESSV